jgi:hypothetical protein
MLTLKHNLLRWTASAFLTAICFTVFAAQASVQSYGRVSAQRIQTSLSLKKSRRVVDERTHLGYDRGRSQTHLRQTAHFDLLQPPLMDIAALRTRVAVITVGRSGFYATASCLTAYLRGPPFSKF